MVNPLSLIGQSNARFSLGNSETFLEPPIGMRFEILKVLRKLSEKLHVFTSKTSCE